MGVGGVGKLFRRRCRRRRPPGVGPGPGPWALALAHWAHGPGSSPGLGPWALAHWALGGQIENHKIKWVLLKIGCENQ